MSKSVALLLGIGMAFAGCLGARNSGLPESDLAVPAQPLGSVLDVNGHECAMAGAVSLNPIPPAFADGLFPEPFKPADTSGYTGLPATETTVGIWHAPFVCEMWEVNGKHAHMGSGGFVGALVEPPPFEGVAPVDHNFLVATLSTRNDAIAEYMNEHGWYVYPGLGMVDPPQDDGPWFTRAVLATAGDGTYESDLALQPQGASWEVLRFWLITEGADGKLHPAHLDMHLEGGRAYTGPGIFFHTGAGDHVGGATSAPVGGLGFADFKFTFSFGVLEATVEEMWDH